MTRWLASVELASVKVVIFFADVVVVSFPLQVGRCLASVLLATFSSSCTFVVILDCRHTIFTRSLFEGFQDYSLSTSRRHVSQGNY